MKKLLGITAIGLCGTTRNILATKEIKQVSGASVIE